MAVRPTISLVIPTHNRASLVVETIQSALDQTTPFFEIIVADDASTDDTLTALRGFGDAIKVIASEKLGVQAVRTKGVASATADYITLCDSDDLLDFRFVEKIGTWLSENPTETVYSNFLVFGETNCTTDKFSQAPSEFFAGAHPSDGFLQDIPNLYEKTIDFQPLFSSGVTIRRDFYHFLGGYDPLFNGVGAEDWEFTLRAVATGRTAVCNEPLVKIRRHKSNDSADGLRMTLGEIKVLEHAALFHPYAQKCLPQIYQGIQTRRLNAFNVAFGLGRMKVAAETVSLLVDPPLNVKFVVKLILTKAWHFFYIYLPRKRRQPYTVSSTAP